MVQWYVKELSQLTNVSVQTLHHYDRINLLKPSIRLPNNYRVYSEKDLIKLQQIIALKFFGFSLSQIKTLLSKPVNINDQLTIQASLLEKKAKTLLEASQTLKKVIADCNKEKSIPWETLIKLIDVYRMTQALEESWMGKKLTPEELKQYVSFEQQVKTKFSEKEKKFLKKAWKDLVKEVNANIKHEPFSDRGIALGKRCIEWVNRYYSKNFASLRTTIWVKGIKEGHLSTETGLTQDAADWLDQAIDAYVKDRTLAILGLIKSHPHEKVLKRWEEMMTDYFGDNQEKRKEFCLRILNEYKLPKVLRNWLQSVSKIYF